MKTSKKIQKTGGLSNPFKNILQFRKPKQQNDTSSNMKLRPDYTSDVVNTFIKNNIENDLNNTLKSSNNTVLELAALRLDKQFKQLDAVDLVKYDTNALLKDQLKKINEHKTELIDARKFDINATQNAVKNYNEKIEKWESCYKEKILALTKIPRDTENHIDVCIIIYNEIINEMYAYIIANIDNLFASLENNLKDMNNIMLNFAELLKNLQVLIDGYNILFQLEHHKVKITKPKIVQKKQATKSNKGDILDTTAGVIIKGIVSVPELINKPLQDIHNISQNSQYQYRQQTYRGDLIQNTFRTISDKWNEMNRNVRQSLKPRPNRNPDNNFRKNQSGMKVYVEPFWDFQKHKFGLDVRLGGEGNIIEYKNSYESRLFFLLSAIQHTISDSNNNSITFIYYERESIDKKTNVVRRKTVELPVSKIKRSVYLMLKFYHLFREYTRPKPNDNGNSIGGGKSKKKTKTIVQKKVIRKKTTKKTLLHGHST
jgi:hypothetical protein